jgi:hypothetical protein
VNLLHYFGHQENTKLIGGYYCGQGGRRAREWDGGASGQSHGFRLAEAI